MRTEFNIIQQFICWGYNEYDGYNEQQTHRNFTIFHSNSNELNINLNKRAVKLLNT